MPKIENNSFLELSLKEIPRLLGQLNRNPSSASYGSFDRAYWHYRTNDISCARYQEAIYALTLLYVSDFENNNYYKDENVLEWIWAALRFTLKLQKANGSFNEWYPNEGSYVATAFVSASLGQSLLALKRNQVSLKEEPAVLDLLRRSARFLGNINEADALNQVSGAVFARRLTGELCENQNLVRHTNRELDKFIDRQNPEGWWNEYGGPDIGYLTLTISYLEKYRTLSNSQKISDSIKEAKAFVENFIQPDKTAGGEYMSRNTEYIIPSLALPYVGALSPAELDDRYLCYILSHWLETGLKLAPQSFQPPTGEKYFKESGILRAAENHYFLTANAKKGDSFRLYAKGKVYYDSGLEMSGFSSGILDSANQISQAPGRLESAGLMKKIKEPLLTTPVMIGFKLWQMLFGRFSTLQRVIKKFLRTRMISYRNRSTKKFKRVIEYSHEKVIITDIVSGINEKNEIMIGLKASYNAVPSSKYAVGQISAKNQLLPTMEKTKKGDEYLIRRVFSFNE